MNKNEQELEMACYILHLKPGSKREQIMQHHELMHKHWTANDADTEKGKRFCEEYQEEIDRARDILLAHLDSQLLN